MFDLTAMQDATETFHQPELVVEQLRLGIYFTFPLENLTELIALDERMPSIAADNFCVDVKVILEKIMNFCSK